jgi:hypothetical protein
MDKELSENLMKTCHFQESRAIGESDIFEDESFPERLLFLDRLFLPDSQLHPDADNLAKKLRRFQKESRGLRAWLNPSAELETVLKTLPNLAPDSNNKYTAYIQIAKEAFSLKGDKERYKICIFLDETKIHGIYIGELLSKGKMGLYCALSSKQFHGITERMDVCFLRQLFQEGIGCVFLGGAETAGVYNYIRKLLPEPPPYTMAPLVYRA